MPDTLAILALCIPVALTALLIWRLHTIEKFLKLWKAQYVADVNILARLVIHEHKGSLPTPKLEENIREAFDAAEQEQLNNG